MANPGILVSASESYKIRYKWLFALCLYNNLHVRIKDKKKLVIIYFFELKTLFNVLLR